MKEKYNMNPLRFLRYFLWCILVFLLFLPTGCEKFESDEASRSLIIFPYRVVTVEGSVDDIAEIGVRLRSNPVSTVNITVSVSDTTEGRVISDQILKFDHTNYNREKRVRVFGLEDSIRDGNIVYSLIFKTPTGQGNNTIKESRVSITNVDNNTPDVIISDLSNSGFTYEGTNSSSLEFSVRLNTQPNADVTINLETLDPTEGRFLIGTIQQFNISLTFTPLNWNVPQSVRIQGRDDNIQDGDIQYIINIEPIISADTTGYNGLDPDNITLVNRDSDTARVEVLLPTTNFILSEDLTPTQLLRIRLLSEPVSNVTVTVRDNDPDVFFNLCSTANNIASFTFTPNNYDIYQDCILNVLSVEDDAIQDGTENGTITFETSGSADVLYSNLNDITISVPIFDNDTAGIETEIDAGFTSENGAQDFFRFRLTSEPISDVTISLQIPDATEAIFSEYTVAGGPSINISSNNFNETFTPNNWDQYRVVTLQGVDDALTDGNVRFLVNFNTIITTDPLYSVLTPADLNFVNLDDDGLGIRIVSATGSLTEDGSRMTLGIQLSGEPGQAGDIEVPFFVSDTTEVNVITTSPLIFNQANWNVTQNIVLEGVDDFLDDGDINLNLVFDPLVSTVALFNGVDPEDLPIINVDNDSSEILVSALRGIPSESGGTASLEFSLGSDPGVDVTLPMSLSSSLAEFTTTGTQNNSITFPQAAWNVPIVVEIRGIDDLVSPVNGNQTVDWRFDPSVSTNGTYNGIQLDPLTIPIADNDSPGIVPVVTDNTAAEGGADTASIRVSLTTPPTSGVVVFDAVVLTPTQAALINSRITLNATNAIAGDSFTISAVDDTIADGTQAAIVRITLNQTLTTSSEYKGSSIFNTAGGYQIDLSINTIDND